MKRISFSLFLAFVTLSCIAQNIGEAFYVYRNDGEFNAFLREEVDSIAYSYYDADSLYYGEIVTQLVYTTDSTYWIPLASIDSVSFVTPETKYTPQVVKLEPLLPYIVGVDGMKLTFSSDTPSKLFPKTDDILVLDNFNHEQFPTGFAGKMSLREGLQITCDSVSFEDIYEQLICYGYFTAINDSSSTENSRVRLIAKKKIGGHVSTSISVTGTLGSRETGLYVAADGSLGLDLRFTFKYRKGEPTYFDISLTPQLSFGLEAGAEGTISKTFEDEEPLFWMPLPDIPFYFKIKGGPISEFSLKASVVARTEAKLGYKFGIKYDNEKFQWDGGNTSKWFSKPDVTGSINGSIFAGFKISYGIYSYGDIISTAIENKAGIEFEASITENIKDPDSFSYDELKDDYLDVNLKASAAFKAEAKLFKWLKWSKKIDLFSGKFNVFKFHLVPSFTKPNVTLDKTSANVSVVPDDHLLFSVLIGLGLWDDSNSLLNVHYCDTPYTDRKSWFLDEFRTSFTNLSLNKEYTVRPLVKLFGATIVAPPEESFKIPIYPITLDAFDIQSYTARVKGRIEGYELLDDNSNYGIGYLAEGETEETYNRFNTNEGDGVFNVYLTSLKPYTKYKYFAYININGEIIRGETKEFTTQGVAYYVWDDANKTTTFYYDGSAQARGGHHNTDDRYSVPIASERVIFDSSFSNYHPKGFTFKKCEKLLGIENLKNLNTDNLTTMSEMFYQCNSLKSLDLSNFNTSNVTSMGGMFYNCSSLKSIDLSNFDTSNLEGSLDCMFMGCSSLESLDLNNFNTSNVISFGNIYEHLGMFSGCSSLKSLNISSFDTSNATDMTQMFCNCSSLTSIDVSHFDTSKVTSMDGMFSGCSSLTSINLSNFDTSNVTLMRGMFRGCSSLTVLDLRSFNTNTPGLWTTVMFYNCTSLQTIYAGDWFADIAVSNAWGQMFEGCTSLTGGKGTKLGKNFYGNDENGNPLYYDCPSNGSAAHVDGGKDWSGLFTGK